MGEDEAQQQLAAHGLLAPVMDEWSSLYRTDYSHWLGYMRELNDHAVQNWIRHWEAGAGGPVRALQPSANRIYGRALNTFSAEVVLSERTFPLEALNLARSIYEASFWLGHLAARPETALDDLEVDELKNRLAREEALVGRHSDDAAILSASEQRVQTFNAVLNGRKRLSIDRIAKSLGRTSRYVEYRVLCGFYGHVSESSLEHHIQTSEGVVANTLGPHGKQIPTAAYFASDALIACSMSHAAIMQDENAASQFQASYRDLKRLEREFQSDLEEDARLSH